MVFRAGLEVTVRRKRGCVKCIRQDKSMAYPNLTKTKGQAIEPELL
ncbi:hypothetical protein M1D47_10315 [Bacillus sp. R1-10]